MLKEKIENLVKESISKSLEQGSLGELKNIPDTIPVGFTKSPEHGDRAISIAMKLAKEAKISPRAIAESIAANLAQNDFEKVDIAGPGFINLTLNWDLLEDVIAEIHSSGPDYGRIAFENRPDTSFSKAMVEYVSANPTGDLHLGHGRAAVLGSALVELLKWSGYEVSAEFYINDAGVQMKKLANSIKQALEIEAGEIGEDKYDSENYPLESMQEFLDEEAKNKLKGASIEDCAKIGRDIFLAAHKKILAEVGSEFDLWYSEKENLHDKDLVEKTCQILKDKGLAYEEDGALWFKAEDFGDERNRVLKKADGNFTYLAGDYAYHLDKLGRGFDKLINLWGADHHGQIPGMKGGLEALGENPEKLEVVLIQMVSLSKGGEEVKMSKREGNVVTVRELAEDVGVDAFRYFLIESQANNRIVFDLELAKKQDKDNPVYYVQYAHARSCSILRNLTAEQIDQENSSSAEAILSDEELKQWLADFKSKESLFKNFTNLKGEEFQSTKALILALANFPEEIKDAALARAPYKIANYIKNLAGIFHQFYTHNRVINDDRELMKARISLVAATRIVLHNALTLLGISAPERM